jgi:hypothetical protein
MYDGARSRGVLSRLEQLKAAYNQQMGTFKRSFAACMDARGYSVN